MRHWLLVVLTLLVLAGHGHAQTEAEESDDPADEYGSPKRGQQQRERLRAIEEHAEDDAADPDERLNDPPPDPTDTANDPPAMADPDLVDPDVDPATDPDAVVVDPDADPTNEDRLSDEVLKELGPPSGDDADESATGKGAHGDKEDAPAGALESPLQVPDDD